MTMFDRVKDRFGTAPDPLADVPADHCEEAGKFIDTISKRKE